MKHHSKGILITWYIKQSVVYIHWKILNSEKLVYICLLRIQATGARNFYLLQNVQTSSGAHPLFMATGVKLLVCEIDHSPPSNAKIKNGCSCTSARATFLHSATAYSGQGLPNYRGFKITLRHTTLSKTSLDKWTAQSRDLWQHTTLTRDRHTCPWRDLTRIPSERPQTHVLERTATEFSELDNYNFCISRYPFGWRMQSKLLYWAAATFLGTILRDTRMTLLIRFWKH